MSMDQILSGFPDMFSISIDIFRQPNSLIGW